MPSSQGSATVLGGPPRVFFLKKGAYLRCFSPFGLGLPYNLPHQGAKKQRKQRNSAEIKNPNWAEILKMLIFGPGRSEIGLRTTIFGISVKNYTGFRNSRPNPWPGGLFRGRVKISTFFRRSASWFRRRIGTKGENTAKAYPNT